MRNILEQAERFEGSRSPKALARMTFWTYVGWRQVMVDTLHVRVGEIDRRLDAAFGRGRRYAALNHVLRAARADETVPSRFALEYRASWLAGALSNGRRAVARLEAQSLG